MSTVVTESMEIIKEYLDALSGQPKTEDLIDRYVTDSSLKAHILEAEAAFPAYELVMHRMVAEGDLVAVHATMRGIHRGAFAGIPATGRQVAAGLMLFYRLDEGRIAQFWMQFDVASLMGQLTA